MKRLMAVLVVFSFLFAISVNAKCDYKEIAELNQDSSAIKITYDEAEDFYELYDGGKEYYHYLQMTILNLSDKFYIKGRNNNTNEENVYKYSPFNEGIVTIDWKDLSKVTTFTFNVYSSNNTNCKDKLFRTIYVTLPRYNPYSVTTACDKVDSSLCDKYVMSESITYEEFLDRIDKTKEQKGNKKDNNNDDEKLNVGIIVGISAGVIVLITTVVIIARRKKDLL